jgi:hypothetical protein
MFVSTSNWGVLFCFSYQYRVSLEEEGDTAEFLGADSAIGGVTSSEQTCTTSRVRSVGRPMEDYKDMGGEKGVRASSDRKLPVLRDKGKITYCVQIVALGC